MIGDQTQAEISFPNIEDIKAMAEVQGPCLSVVGATSIFAGDALGVLTLRNMRTRAAEQLQAAGANPDEYLDVLEASGLPSQASGVALYRCRERGWRFSTPYSIEERVVVAPHFHVLPLLRSLQMDREFYLLVLSQKRMRLLRCTLTAYEEVALPAAAPVNLEEFNEQNQPNDRLENRRSHAGAIVAFGTSSDSDSLPEYLYHFYNEIDKQLQVLLRSKPLPMVVAGVDYEVALYHKVSEYPALAPGGVQGAADGLKGGELHARGLEVLEGYFQERLGKALASHERSSGERIMTSVPDIVEAAFDGRILHLFIAEGASCPGSFDERTRKATPQPESGDLLDLAVLQTISHGGQVFTGPLDRVPGGAQAAATLRF